MAQTDPSVPDSAPDSSLEFKKQNRPFSLTLILIFSFVLHLLLFLAAFTALVTAEIIQSTLQQYYKNHFLTIGQIRLFSAGGAVLFALAISGLILMWKMRKAGFYLYLISQVILFGAIWKISGNVDLVNLLIALLVILIMALHIKMMR